MTRASAHADGMRVDELGNLIVYKKGSKSAPNPLMLCAHMDEVGLIVRGITDEGCFDFSAGGEKLVVYRLWNEGGQNGRNSEILQAMHHHFPGEWVKVRRGERIGTQTYLEYGEKFDWPDLSVPDGGERVFCYGLRDQIGVLCDGTVVPCCLDHEGDIPLGNLLEQGLGEILDSARTQAICRGFDEGRAVEKLCRRCGYARQKFG